MNPYSAHDRLEAQTAACFAAVQSEFRWLPLREIIQPAHRQFDALLARQVALHLMVHHFDIPKRRVVELHERSREAVNRALRNIDLRLNQSLFADAYQRMTAEARELYSIQLSEAA